MFNVTILQDLVTSSRLRVRPSSKERNFAGLQPGWLCAVWAAAARDAVFPCALKYFWQVTMKLHRGCTVRSMIKTRPNGKWKLPG